MKLDVYKYDYFIILNQIHSLIEICLKFNKSKSDLDNSLKTVVDNLIPISNYSINQIIKEIFNDYSQTVTWPIYDSKMFIDFFKEVDYHIRTLDRETENLWRLCGAIGWLRNFDVLQENNEHLIEELLLEFNFDKKIVQNILKEVKQSDDIKRIEALEKIRDLFREYFTKSHSNISSLKITGNINEQQGNQNEKNITKEMDNDSLKLFVAYSSADRNLCNIIKNRLDIYLFSAQNNYKTIWTDREIPIGGDWSDVIQQELFLSNIGILLVSPMLLGSKYSMSTEFKNMLIQRKTKGYIIIPILLRDCNFNNNTDLVSIQFFRTYQSEYDVTDILRKDKLMPFDELAEIPEPNERLLNKYFQKLANEIDKASTNLNNYDI